MTFQDLVVLLLAIRKGRPVIFMNTNVNSVNSTEPGDAPKTNPWKEIVARYQKPSTARAVWQLVNTLVPYAALWCLMYYTKSVSWWLTVPLAVLAGAILVRAFIIFHDCGHGSFFKSPVANHVLGAITGVLTFTPFYHWRWEHAIHHSTSGIWTGAGREMCGR